MQQPPFAKPFPVARPGPASCPRPKPISEGMLPVVDKPLIQYAVEEPTRPVSAHDFCHGRSKRAIEDHFDTAYELENRLETSAKREAFWRWCARCSLTMNERLRAPATLARPGPRRAVRRAAGGQRTVCRAAGRRPDDGPQGWRARAIENGAKLSASKGRSLLAVQEVPADQGTANGIVGQNQREGR